MQLSNRKYFLTGASGFIGTTVVNFFGKENLVLIFKLINILNKGKLSIIT
jgi:nucleoside-diphosphate-sugar epimerase